MAPMGTGLNDKGAMTDATIEYIWQCIYAGQIPIVPLYFAAQRPVVERDGTLLMVDDDRMPLELG